MKTKAADHPLFMGIAAMLVLRRSRADARTDACAEACAIAGRPRPVHTAFRRAFDNAVNNSAQDLRVPRTNA
ncbi:MAG TPA: hypothetical protein VGM81_10255 [Burkholderiaceae bacterium]